MNKLSIVLVLALAVAAYAGVIPNDWESKIVGGQVATPGQFPYIVALRNAANSPFCGGWIHNSRWAVSVAHCTVGRTLAATRVAVGAQSRTDGTVHASARIVNHPNYNANTLANDLSCIQTSAAITFNARVQSIPLGTANVGGGVACIVKGWGTTSSGGSGSAQLMFVHQTTMTNAQCVSGHPGNANMIIASKICTGSPVGQGPCQGDSGSAVTVGNSVAGAVSWGIGCANGRPDVNTRISSFNAWLVSTMV